MHTKPRTIEATGTVTYSRSHGSAGHLVIIALPDGSRAIWETKTNPRLYFNTTVAFAARVADMDWETGDLTITHLRRTDK